ncbi:MAG: RDD family protein [Pseudomonadota bacterium]
MYFWNIYKLKKELAISGLNRQKVWLYLLAILIVQIVPGFFIDEKPGFWDTFEGATFFVLLISGTIYCYKANGGPNRKKFWERYISLAWVFGIRYTCIMMIPIIILYMILHIAIPGSVEVTTWYDIAITSFWGVLFYYLLAEHIRNVSQNKIDKDSRLYKWLKNQLPKENFEPLDPSQYPDILTRYLATTIDGVFIVLSFIGISYLFQGNEMLSISVRLTVIFLLLFIYEPIFTSKLCTLGQKVMKIRVRSIQELKNIPLHTAYIRILIKLVLGIISFFTIPFTKNKRGVHDLAAGSVVIYANIS